jgi:hypothetical protein
MYSTLVASRIRLLPGQLKNGVVMPLSLAPVKVGRRRIYSISIVFQAGKNNHARRGAFLLLLLKRINQLCFRNPHTEHKKWEELESRLDSFDERLPERTFMLDASRVT